MKRIIVLIVTLATAMVFMCGSSYTYIETEDFETPAEYADLMKQQEKPLEAYHTLYSTFEMDENGEYIYPDEYAGEWIDGDKLIIALTDTSKTVIMKYYQILKDYDCIQIEEVKYSLNYLKQTAEQVYEAVDNEKITMYSVDVKNNGLNFGYNGDVNELKRALNFYNSELSNEINVEYSEAPQKCTSLMGGMEISACGKKLTLGMCGTGGSAYSGKAIVISGHNMELSGDVKIGSSLIGKIRVLNFREGAYGDYAIAYVSSNDNLTNLVMASNTTSAITGYANSIPVGTVYLRYGKETQFSVHRVCATGVTTYMDMGNNTYVAIKGITQGSVLSGSSGERGDSGGPIYYEVSGKKYFVGVHSSVTTDYNFFTPYQYFSGVFTPKTTS